MPVAPLDCTELRATIAQIARAMLRQGNTLDGAVKKIIKLFPDNEGGDFLTREEIVDAILAYGRKSATKMSDETKSLLKGLGEAKADRQTRERIDRLEKMIEGLPVEAKTTKQRAQVSAALKELRALEKSLKEEATIPLRDERLKNQIEELEKKLEDGDIAERQGKPFGPKEELIAKRDELKKELAARAADKQRRDKLRKTIEELRNQLRYGVNAPAAKESAKVDTELQRLIFEKQRLEAKVRQRIEDEAPLSWSERLTSPIHALKALMTTMDLSFIGRQGAMTWLSGRFNVAGKAFMEQFRAIKSEADLARVTEELMQRPNGPIYKKAKLEIADHMEELEARSIQKLLRYTPAAFADRAFAAAGNRMRADLFDMFYDALENPTIKEAEWIASMVNDMTLRSTMDPKVARFANNFLFSARALKARLRILSGMPVWSAPSGQTRKMALKQYGRMLIGVTILMGMAKALGMLGSEDPRSSDFLKIKAGDTRVDPLAGLSQFMTFGARMMTGETVPTSGKDKGKVIPLRGEGTTPFRNMKNTIFSFVRSKLSPAASLAADAGVGEDYSGQPFDMRRAMLERTIPLSIQESYDIMRSEGATKGTAMTALSLLGLGVKHYGGDQNDDVSLSNDIIRMLGGEPNTKPDKSRPTPASPASPKTPPSPK